MAEYGNWQLGVFPSEIQIPLFEQSLHLGPIL